MSQLRFASRHLAESVICCAIILLGLTVTSGWLLHVPAMVEIKSGLVPMVFNTGLCFLIAGLIMLTIRKTGRPVAMGRSLFGGFLVLLCSTTLLEIWLDRDLGIDLGLLHAWHDYGNTKPGRMAPNTAIGFILIGMAIMLSNRVRSRWQALTLIGLTFSILTVGLTGLVGYYLAPDLLFGWAKSARMAVHTASGMILCGIALWLHWCGSKWYVAAHFIRQDEKIRFLGAAILIIVTITAGLGGFVLQQRSLQSILESELTSTRNERLSLFQTAVAEVEGDASTAIRLLGFDKISQSILNGTASTETKKKFELQGAQLIDHGFRGALLEDHLGRPVRMFGRLHQSPELIAKANTSDLAELVWDMGLVLRIKLPLYQNNGKKGMLIIDKQVPSLRQTLFDNSIIGQSGEVAICSTIGHYLHCFPGVRHSTPFLIPLRSKTGKPLPMEIALAGNKGIIHAIDYRNQNVIAAYAPLGPNLGIVVKQDTAELYGVIRKALSYGLPLIAMLSLLGAMLLYLQLKPLTSRLIQSEKNASDKEQELRTIMHAVSDGLLTLDSNGQIKSANPAAYNLFRYAPHTLVNQRISALLTADMQKAHSYEMAQLMEDRPHFLIDKPNLEMIGLTKNGSEFPIEITVTQVEISNQILYVLAVRDITQRKEVQNQLAALAHYDFLTGLPNRSLFMDRLSTAKLRLKRNNTSIALMFLDLDGFKKINDTLGHQSGDELLVQFARRIKSAVRATDTVGRLSGDEFTVLLEGLDSEENANQVAQKIIHAMQIPFEIKSQKIRVTTSLGMVIHHHHSENLDVKELLNRADKAMYVAKNTGKNSISIA
jgi:diguanylate cyclase (GGDEF)-like protein/PAS domain S-box-containing protein